MNGEPMRLLMLLVTAFVLSQPAGAKGKSTSMNDQKIIPYEYLADHLILVPVTINGEESKFVLDTGAGMEVISTSLARKFKCKKNSSFTGSRMTGEKITLDLTEIAEIRLGQHIQTKVEVGITDIFDKLPPDFAKIEGALSLSFFKSQPFTIDYAAKQIILHEPSELAALAKKGHLVKTRTERLENKTVGFFANITVNDAYRGEFEVDTGNTITILPLKAMEKAGVSKNTPGLKKVSGKNETGHDFTKYYSEVKKISLTDHPKQVDTSHKVAFTEIIYDGVIGNEFLKLWKVTFDVSGSQMVFTP